MKSNQNRSTLPDIMEIKVRSVLIFPKNYVNEVRSGLVVHLSYY